MQQRVRRAAVRLLLCLALLVPGLARPVQAQQRRDDTDSLEIAARAGVGFSASPETFVLSLDLPVHVEGGAWLGPKLRLGVSDRWTYVAGSAAFEYVFDLGREFDDDILKRLSPVLGTGLGFTYLDDDRRNRDDTGLLIHLDMGLEYRVTDAVSIGSHMRFDFLPVDAINESFIYNWQVLTTRVRF